MYLHLAQTFSDDNIGMLDYDIAIKDYNNHVNHASYIHFMLSLWHSLSVFFLTSYCCSFTLFRDFRDARKYSEIDCVVYL